MLPIYVGKENTYQKNDQVKFRSRLPIFSFIEWLTLAFMRYRVVLCICADWVSDACGLCMILIGSWWHIRPHDLCFIRYYMVFWSHCNKRSGPSAFVEWSVLAKTICKTNRTLMAENHSFPFSVFWSMSVYMIKIWRTALTHPKWLVEKEKRKKKPGK